MATKRAITAGAMKTRRFRLTKSASALLKNVLVAIALIAITPLAAEARPSTRSFTCEGARDYIASRGAVVMNTKNSSIYRRFVTHAGFCQFGEDIEYYVAPTKSGKCRLKICREIDFEDFPWRRR